MLSEQNERTVGREKLFTSFMLCETKIVGESLAKAYRLLLLEEKFVLLPAGMSVCLRDKLQSTPVYCLEFSDFFLETVFERIDFFFPLHRLLKTSANGWVFGKELTQSLSETFFFVYEKDPESSGLKFLELLQMLSVAKEKEALFGDDPEIPLLSINSGNIPIYKTYEYIRTHYDEDLDELSMASMACLATYSFSRKFKKIVGCSFRDFLQRVRIRHTLELIRQTGRSLTDISLCCGFQTPGQYNKIFKKWMKKSPQQYRDELGEIKKQEEC